MLTLSCVHIEMLVSSLSAVEQRVMLMSFLREVAHAPNLWYDPSARIICVVAEYSSPIGPAFNTTCIKKSFHTHEDET